MSSPAGLQYSRADILARWMPGTNRAGVILDRSPDLDGPSRFLLTNDSFSSDFAPLSASADSSCSTGGGHAEAPVTGVRPGPAGGVSGPGGPGEMAHGPPDQTLVVKLEQLRKWQQHMQQQLRAHQLEELLGLQEQQQRLLGKAGQSPLCTEDGWNSRGDDGEKSFGENCDQDEELRQQEGRVGTRNTSKQENEDFQDRPIKPGISGQKQTFEELLEEQLKLEEQRLKSAQQQKSLDGAQARPKRAFLKRGEGLSRFTGSRKPVNPPPPASRAVSRSNSAPVFLQRAVAGGAPAVQVQRKTATLNKENRARVPRVLGRHQRPNTEKTEPPPAKRDQTGTQRASEDRNPQGPPPPDCWELSFQEKLQLWESDRRMESMELGEFELLEQAAEELSFSSNSSFVQKILQMDVYSRQRGGDGGGLYERRLSSTPIKSPPGGGAQKCSGVPEDGCGRSQRQLSDVSSGSGSEFGDPPEVEVGGVGGRVHFPEPTNPPYDKSSYQDQDQDQEQDQEQDQDQDQDQDHNLDQDQESLRDSAPEEEEESGGDSTLTEGLGSGLGSGLGLGLGSGGRYGEVVFDDHDTWNDPEETAIGPVPGPERTLSEPQQPPPASQLMTRLFPSLKPKAQSPPFPSPPPHAANPETKRPKDQTVSPSGQQPQSAQLRERLAELEIEIQRFKKENASLAKLRQENEKIQEELRKERFQFEQTKKEELAKFEEYKREETRKLQRERKLFEKHATAARAIPDKKERDEIQALKQQLGSLQEELRRRESRWASTQTRLRGQIDSLNQDNVSLRDEIRMLEKLRLSALKKSSIPAERDSETRDVPRTAESFVPAVTKGVTFASPLDSRGGSCSPPLSGNPREASESKSSLRRSGSSGSGRRTERPEPASKTQEKPPDRRPQDGSPKPDQRPLGAESSDLEEPGQEVLTHPDGKTETVLANGDRLITFPNGTRKEVSADGLSAKVTFFNGDTKQVTADQRVIYYYAQAQTTHITYPDAMEVLHFPNGQTEKHFPDGRKEITFPDQTVKNLFPDGREESVLTDGTIIQVNPDGSKEIHFNTGQREVHTAEYKRREYPDGTVKTVFSDGRQETRYPTGRLRIKDKDGRVVLDNRG